MLAHLDKGHTGADVREALHASCATAGIALRPTWVAFTPWTTLDDYRAMLDFVDAEDLVDHVDPVQFSVRLLVPPGSLLLEHGALRPHLGRARRGRVPLHWTHPDPRMDALHADVTALVADAAARSEDAEVTFGRIRGCSPGAPAPVGDGAHVATAARAHGAPADRSRGSAEASPRRARWPSRNAPCRDRRRR